MSNIRKTRRLSTLRAKGKIVEKIFLSHGALFIYFNDGTFIEFTAEIGVQTAIHVVDLEKK